MTDPVFDLRYVRAGKCRAEGHARSKVPFQDLDQRTVRRISLDDRAPMLISACDYRLRIGHREAAGLGLTRMTTLAIGGQDWADCLFESSVWSGRQKKSRRDSQHNK